MQINEEFCSLMQRNDFVFLNLIQARLHAENRNGLRHEERL